MKIKKYQIKKLIAEYANNYNLQLMPNYDNQYFDLSSLKDSLSESAISIFKNNRLILEKIIKNISEIDKSAISNFNKMMLQEQISTIINANGTTLKESKDNDKENLNLNSVDSPEKELFNALMGNPTGIKNKSELKNLSHEDIISLANSVKWNKSVRAIGTIIASAGAGFGLTYGPDLLVSAINPLVQPLYDYAGIAIPSFTIPVFNQAALVFFIIAILYSLQQILVFKFKKQINHYSKKSDREKLEDEIASGLYLDDPDHDSNQASSYQNIKMMIKNILRFFTQ